MFTDKKENEMCCDKCMYFQSENKFCRRFPPTPVVVESNNVGNGNYSINPSKIITKFPIIPMPHVDFCGEFAKIK